MIEQFLKFIFKIRKTKGLTPEIIRDLKLLNEERVQYWKEFIKQDITNLIFDGLLLIMSIVSIIFGVIFFLIIYNS